MNSMSLAGGLQANFLSETPSSRRLPDQASGPLTSEEREHAALRFEEMFVSLMLKEMRATLSEEDGFFGGGPAGDTYGGMFDQYLGAHIAQQGGIGIGQQIARYIEAQNS